MLIMLGLSLGLTVQFRFEDAPHGEDLAFERWLNDKRTLFEGYGAETVVDPLEDPVQDPDKTRSDGGQLSWQVTIPSFEGKPVSTPTLADLDGDGHLEIVVASAGDAVFAFRSDGSQFWTEPYTDDVIDCLGQTAGTSGLDFEPPPFFSSPVTADLNEAEGPEVFLGVKNGLLCLGSDGSRLWRKGLTTGNYFSSPCVTDLEGEWSGRKEDLEVVCAADDESRRGWIEAYGPNGTNLFCDEAPTGGEGGLIGCAVVAQDLDGDFWDGPEQVMPGQDREKDTELIIGNHDRGLRIWGRSGQTPEGTPIYEEATFGMTGGHQTYATAAVANVTGGPECEIFIGSSEGYACCWTGWGGMLHVYTPEGKQLWSYNVGSSDASIFSSPALADLQGAASDPSEKHLDYEVMFGNDKGILYVLNTEFHNLLWSFDTKGRVLSSPAVCNIDRDDELEVIIASDSGKVFCLDGDPSDGENDGMAYQGDGIQSDVIWVYDTGVPIGISSSVVADIDLDGVLEVVIGDSKGNIYCISAGGGVPIGRIDWPTFHGNANRTGFYCPQNDMGIDIRPRPEGNRTSAPISCILSPGEEVTFDLTVHNGESDLFKVDRHIINVTIQDRSVPEGWSAWLDTPPEGAAEDPPYVRLRSGEEIDITLHVKAPRVGRMIRMARVNVTCTSTIDSWVRDMITLTALMEIDMELELYFAILASTDPLDPFHGTKWVSMLPGTVQDISVTVRNVGDLNSSLTVALNEPPLEAGWNWYFSGTESLQTTMVLSSSDLEQLFGGVSESNLKVRIEVPEGAPKGQLTPILLMGSQRAINVTDVEDGTARDELKVLIAEQSEIRFWADQTTKFIDPNGVVEYTLYISNQGNKDLVKVLMSSSQALSGWTVSYQQEPIDVYRGQTKPVNVKISAPGYVKAYKKCVLSITHVIEGSPNYNEGVTLTTIVNPVHNFDAVVLNKEGIKIDLGKRGSFDVRISNIGNDQDVIKARGWKLEPGWELSLFNAEGNQNDEFLLDFETSMTIKGQLKVPINTRTGWYMVGLNLTGIGSSMVVYLKVFINQTFGLEVTMVDGFKGMKMEVRPEQERSLVLKVKNKGNGLDHVVLSLGADNDGTDRPAGELGEGWSGTFYAVSSTPEPPMNVRLVDLREPIRVPREGPDLYLITSPPNLTGANPIDFHEVFLLLDEWTSAYVHLKMRAPSEGSEDRTYDLLVSGQGSGGRADHDNETLRFEIHFPNVQYYGGITLSGGTGSRDRIAKEGELLTIQVNIRNTGSIMVEDVDVALYLDGSLRMTRTIKTLERDTGSASDVRTVAFSWVAEEGKHRVKVVIDPEDNIIESEGGEGLDNTLSKTINVKGRSTFLGGMNDSPIVSVILFVLLIVLSFTAIIVFLRLRKRY